MSKPQEKVVVIGAGASGLACARDLQKAGSKVTVVEAHHTIGGRCICLKDFVSWKDIDLGAEFVHGNEHSLMDLIREHGLPCRTLFTWAQGDGETPKYPVNGGMSMYYFGKEKTLFRYDTKDERITKVNDLLWEFGELKESPELENVTVGDWLKKHGISGSPYSLALAGYTNTLCSNNDKCSLKAVIPLENSWDVNGEGDYRLENGMYDVIRAISKGLDIKTNWVVKSVNYENKGNVVITSTTGEKLECDKVVVSVSLGVLKAGAIEFIPPLPQKKLDAIKKVDFEVAMKVAMKFSKRFWPKELHGIICSDTIIPEFWFDGPERVGSLAEFSSPELIKKVDDKEPTYLCSGFACSNFANYIASLTKEEAISKVLAQLDEMFGSKDPSELLKDLRLEDHPHTPTPNSKTPATDAFLDCIIQNWGQQPYVLGGYSSPTIGETAETRDALAETVNGVVFFCGEHTNRSYMTLNSAVKSGEMAAERIIKSKE